MYYTTEITDNSFRESFKVHNESTRQEKITGQLVWNHQEQKHRRKATLRTAAN